MDESTHRRRAHQPQRPQNNNTTAIVHNIPASLPLPDRHSKRTLATSSRSSAIVRSSSGARRRQSDGRVAQLGQLAPPAASAEGNAPPYARSTPARASSAPRPAHRARRTAHPSHAARRASARRSSAASGLRSSFRALDSSASCAWSQDELASHAVNDAHTRRHRRRGGCPPRACRSPDWNGRRILLANLVVLAVVACFALLFRFAARAVHPVRRRLAGDGGQAGRRMAAPPRRRALGRRAGDLRAARLSVRGVLTLAVPIVAEQAATLVARAPHHFERLRTELLASDSNTLRRIAWYLPAAVERGGVPDARRQGGARHGRRRGPQPVHGRRGAAARVLLDAGGRAAHARAGAVRAVRPPPIDPRLPAPRSSVRSAPTCAGSRWSA